MSLKQAKVSNEDRLIGVFSTLLEELNAKRPANDETNFAVDRLRTRMRKRAKICRPDLKTDALNSFKRINDIVRETSVTLDAFDVSNARYFITHIFERFTSRLNPNWVQVPLDLNYLFDNWRYGPGTSNGVKGTHTAEKLYEKMTCTSSSVPLVLQLRRNNTYLRQFDMANGDNGIDVMRGSRLTTVPKNEETERTIAIEPSGNMALQLAAGRYIEEVLKSIGLDISHQQPKNKALAFSGSIDGSIATIDLKSASDMISIDLVRLLMPPDWFDLLMKLRSPMTEINGEEVEMYMMSTMGNGFTFPLMTLLLTSLIYALRCRSNGPTLFIDWSKTAVFGDDIIIPVEEYTEMCRILEAAGLVVNLDKSYSEGLFRESCGGDFYNGANVTPFYIESLSNNSEIYVAINKVLEWCAKTRVSLPLTLLTLRSMIVGDPFFVPEWHNPDSGIMCSQVERKYKYLQPVIEYRILKNMHFSMMLAVGGYTTPQGLNHVYAPRLNKTRMLVKKARLPKGFLSGCDPSKRSQATTDYIDSLVWILK